MRIGSHAPEAQHARAVGEQPDLVAGEMQAEALAPRAVAALQQRKIASDRDEIAGKARRANATKQARRPLGEDDLELGMLCRT